MSRLSCRARASVIRGAVILIALAGTTLAGCYESSGSRSHLSPHEFDFEYAKAVCANLASCGPISGPADTTAVLQAGVEACAARKVADRYAFWSLAQSSLDSGRMRYDEDAAKRCIEAIPTTCASPNLGLSSPVQACRTVFVGTVPPGGACANDEECAGDALCAGSDELVACGVCRPRPAIGESCSSSARCAQTVPNGYATCEANGKCAAVTYVPDVGRGDACGRLGSTAAGCGRGLYCKPTSEDGFGPGTCEEPIALGAPCRSWVDLCAMGSTCYGEGGAASTCIPIVVQTTVSADCGGFTYCNEFLRLSCESAACRPYESGEEGSSCDGHLYLECRQGLRCLQHPSGDHTCEKPKPNGSACNPLGDGEECASGNCDPDTAKCATWLCE